MSKGVRLRATVVRAAKPYRAFEPTSGEGAAKFGGRFNPVGTPALYTSFSFNTAAKEVRFSLNADPYTFYFLEIDCDDIADLTDPAVRAACGVSLSDLECPNWESEMRKGVEPSSHAVARRLIAEGLAGAIVPSFASGADRGDRNLVLWTWVDMTGASSSDRHSVRVLERDALPSTLESWPRRP